MRSSQEEADSKMIFHIKSISAPKNVVVRTADTDVLIIALGNLRNIDPSINVWLEVGLLTQNTLRYINVNDLRQSLGQTLCDALPAFHAITGCDYTASFKGKGKVRPLKVLEKDVDAQNVFALFGIEEEISETLLLKTEKFVCTA